MLFQVPLGRETELGDHREMPQTAALAQVSCCFCGGAASVSGIWGCSVVDPSTENMRTTPTSLCLSRSWDPQSLICVCLGGQLQRGRYSSLPPKK